MRSRLTSRKIRLLQRVGGDDNRGVDKQLRIVTEISPGCRIDLF